MYGSNVNAEGVAISQVGIQHNVEFIGVKFEDRLSFTFKQENGALVTHSEFEANASYNVETQQTDTSRRVKHIAEALNVELNIEDTDSFEEYSNQIVEQLSNPGYKGTFNMLFVYNKRGFVGLPKYPSFIESTDTEPTTLKISEYNRRKLIKPEEPKPDSEPIEKEEAKLLF